MKRALEVVLLKYQFDLLYAKLLCDGARELPFVDTSVIAYAFQIEETRVGPDSRVRLVCARSDSGTNSIESEKRRMRRTTAPFGLRLCVNRR